MLDQETKNKIIQSFVNDTKEFRCSHQEYVEACGLYCSAIRNVSSDMNGLRKYCNKDCKHYQQPGSQKRSEEVIQLFNDIKTETIDHVMRLIADNPNADRQSIINMLLEEKNVPYAEIC